MLSVQFLSGVVKKIFWIIVTLSMFGGLLYNVSQLTIKYLQFQVQISMDISSTPEMVFPSVTICNTSPVKKSALDAASNVKSGNRKKRATLTGWNKNIYWKNKSFVNMQFAT